MKVKLNIPKNTRNITICSSKRPHRLKDTIASYLATRSDFSQLVVYVSTDDPLINEYNLNDVNYIIGPYRTLVEVTNHISCNVLPDFEYYSEVNDDHIYRTNKWDESLIHAIETHGQGWGMSYGYTQHLPTAIMMSGNIVKTLGCFFYREFKHQYIDNYLKDITEGIHRKFYVKDVFVEHCHPGFGKAQQDEIYAVSNGDEQSKYGLRVYTEWCRDKKVADINKLLSAIANSQPTLALQ